jgi:hypothetical protein
MRVFAILIIFIYEIGICQEYSNVLPNESIKEAIERLKSDDSSTYLLQVTANKGYEEIIVLNEETLDLKAASNIVCNLTYDLSSAIEAEEIILSSVFPVFKLEGNSKLNLTSVTLKVPEFPHEHEEDHDHEDEDHDHEDEDHDHEDEDHDHEEEDEHREIYAFIFIVDNGIVNLKDVLIINFDVLNNLGRDPEITIPIITVNPKLESNVEYNGKISLVNTSFANIEFHETSFIVLLGETSLSIENSSFSAEETLSKQNKLKYKLGEEEDDDHDHEHEHEAAWLIYMEEEKGLKINISIKSSIFATLSAPSDVLSDIEVMCIVGNNKDNSVCVFDNCTFNAFSIREVDIDEPHAPTFFHFINLSVTFTSCKVVGDYGNNSIDIEVIEHCWQDAIFYFENSIGRAEGLSFEHVQGGIYAVNENSEIYLNAAQFTNVTQIASQFHTARKALICTDSKVYYTSLNDLEKKDLWIKDNNCKLYANNTEFTPDSFLTVPSLTNVLVLTVKEKAAIAFEGTNLIPKVCQFILIDPTNKEIILDDNLNIEVSNETHIVFNISDLEIPEKEEDLEDWNAQVKYVTSGWCEGEEPNYSKKTDKKLIKSPSDDGYDIGHGWKGLSLILVMSLLMIVMF